MGMQSARKWPRKRILVLGIFALLIVLHIGDLLETELIKRSYEEYRVIYKDDSGNIFYSDWLKEGELEEEDPRIQYYKEQRYHELTTEERTISMTGLETFLDGKFLLKKELFSIKIVSFIIDQYRVIMEDFSGNRYSSSWVENQIEVKRRMVNYAEEGYFNLETEEKTTRIRRCEIFILFFGFEVNSSDLSLIYNLLLVAVKISLLVLLILLLFNPEISWDEFLEDLRKLFSEIKTILFNRPMIRQILEGIGRALSWIRNLLRRATNRFDSMRNFLNRIKGSYQRVRRLFEKAQPGLKVYYGHIIKFLSWEAVKSVVKICFLVFVFATMFGKWDYLIRTIDKSWPYVTGALVASILVSIATAVFLRSIENVDEGLVIEFEKNVGRIKNLGLFFTKISTPRNETIHIPNLMLSMRVIKRLTSLEKEKPYIVHFEVTLSYEIPYGIVSNLYLLAVRDTIDDFEDDFEKRRLRKGMECIRGFLKDVEDKIQDLKERINENDKEIKRGIRKLETQLKIGKGKLHEVAEDVEGLLKDIGEMNEDLKERISDNDKEIKRGIKELKTQLETQLKVGKGKLHEVAEDVEGFSEYIEDLKERISENDKVEKKIKELKIQLEAGDERLRKGVKGIKGSLKDIEDRIEDLKERISDNDKVEKKIEELRIQLEAGDERLRKGTECIEGLLKDIKDLKERISENDKVKKRIEELSRQLKAEEDYTPYIIIEKLDRHTVNYEFHAFTDHPYHLLKIKHYLMNNIKRRFDEFGIEIMSPSQVSRREFREPGS